MIVVLFNNIKFSKTVKLKILSSKVERPQPSELSAVIVLSIKHNLKNQVFSELLSSLKQKLKMRGQITNLSKIICKNSSTKVHTLTSK